MMWISTSEAGSLGFSPARYRVVKIMHSSFEVVLQTMKHIMVYRCSGPYSKVIGMRPVI
jgi:hypothetical protein